MPRSIRTTKRNHAPRRRKQRTAIVPLPERAALDLTELRSRHPDITDTQADICCDLVFRGRSPQECATERNLPPEWVHSQFTKPAVAAFLQDLAMAGMGPAAVLAHRTMQSLLHARSSYVRYSAAQDLMDRAGLRTTQHGRDKASAAQIMINIGVAAPTPTPMASVTIDQGAPDDLPPEKSTA